MSGKLVIVGLPYGGTAWGMGIRNGMAAELAAGVPLTGNWGSIHIQGSNFADTTTLLPQDLSRPNSILFVLVFSLFGLALLIRSFSPVPAWLLLFGSAAVSSSVLIGRFAEPWSILCWLAPLLIAGLALSEQARSRWRIWISISVAGLVALLAGVALAAEAPGGDAPDLLLVGPLAFGLLACALACAIGLYDALIRARGRSGGPLRPVMVFNELVPGRNSARLAAIDEERDRLAMDLHDEVLPNLTALTRRLEHDSPQAAATCAR